MIANYVKAARVLLSWSQERLAETAGVALTAVKNFEGGKAAVRQTTLLAIVASLEAAGIEFLDGGGVRLRNDKIESRTFSGDDFVEKHNQMIYATLRTPGGEILTCSPDDLLWTGPLARKANTEFKKWRARLDIRGKTITVKGQKIFNEPRHQYRFLPEVAIGTISYVIYGPCISFLLWREKKAFVLKNKVIVDSFKNQFLYLWERGQTH